MASSPANSPVTDLTQPLRRPPGSSVAAAAVVLSGAGSALTLRVGKPSLLVQSPREVPGAPSRPASTRVSAGRNGCDGAFLEGFQMSRKRLAGLVTGDALVAGGPVEHQ